MRSIIFRIRIRRRRAVATMARGFSGAVRYVGIHRFGLGGNTNWYVSAGLKNMSRNLRAFAIGTVVSALLSSVVMTLIYFDVPSDVGLRSPGHAPIGLNNLDPPTAENFNEFFAAPMPLDGI